MVSVYPRPRERPARSGGDVGGCPQSTLPPGPERARGQALSSARYPSSIRKCMTDPCGRVRSDRDQLGLLLLDVGGGRGGLMPLDEGAELEGQQAVFRTGTPQDVQEGLGPDDYGLRL